MNPFVNDPEFVVRPLVLFSSSSASLFDLRINTNYALSVQKNQRFISQREKNYTTMIIVPTLPFLLLIGCEFHRISAHCCLYYTVFDRSRSISSSH